MWYWRDRAKQLIDYDSLSFGKMHPTDIDGIIEYRDRAYLIFEYKLKGKALDKGQELCLERMTNDFRKAGKIAAAIVCDHYVEDTDQDVVAGDAIIRKVYVNGVWCRPIKEMKVYDFVKGFIDEQVSKH